ncbi:MAG: DMT family transporter [Phycisphaerae bacterium]|nr:DMT family transporter [Phycisphaerae bacterium]
MAITGIILGLLAAFSHSLSYLFSRMFVGKFHNSSVILLALSHVIMGVFSLILLPFVWVDGIKNIPEYGIALVSCTLFYLAAQVCLFIAFKKTDASRVAPLLGLKVFFIAMISLVFFHHTFTPLQWVAVALSVGSTIALTQTGGKLSGMCLTWILIACLGYGLSDLGINSLIDHFEAHDLSKLHSTVLSVCLCYILSGLIGLVILKVLPRPTTAMWKYALPFAMTWYVAMFFLFGCFAHVGVVYGVILQSTRGVISIIMGYIIAKSGFVHLEQKTSKMVLLRRILAAILMLGAIGLYYAGART